MSTQNLNLPPAALLAGLKATQPFAHTDDMRPYLTDILAVRSAKALTLCATNGHVLLQVTLDSLPETEPFATMLSRAQVEQLLLTAKQQLKSQGAVDFAVEVSQTTGFPDVAKVIPAIVDEEVKATAHVGVDLRYLAVVAKAQAALKARGGTLRVGATAADPIRIDIKSDYGTAIAVVMPMRM